MSSPTAFTASFPKRDVDDLRARLKATRWPTEVEGTGWDHGAPLPWVRSLAESWANAFDFRRAEERLNEFPNFTARVGATLLPSATTRRRKQQQQQQLRDRPTSLAPIELHFIHKRANRDRPAAPPPLPLLLLHGWPGSVVEFLAVVGPLSDPGPESPTAQAFDVVVPSLPGFGFSEAPRERGWGIAAMASCFHSLMTDVLKYNRYCVQGGDWGSMIARRMALDYGVVPAPPSLLDKLKSFFSSSRDGGAARKRSLLHRSSSGVGGGSVGNENDDDEDDANRRKGVVALHQNMAVASPRLSSPRTILQALNAPLAHRFPVFLTREEALGLKGLLTYQSEESGYFKVQSTKPMTLGYGLADSPAGVLSWISEKFHGWGDNGPDRSKNPDEVPGGAFARDDILLNACLYWFGNRGCSSVRIYREVEEQSEIKEILDGYVRVPTGVLDQPRELFRPPRAWIAAGSNLKHFTRASHGGHFAALERPKAFVDDVRYHFGNWGR